MTIVVIHLSTPASEQDSPIAAQRAQSGNNRAVPLMKRHLDIRQEKNSKDFQVNPRIERRTNPSE
jgi:hypothetical protein